MRQRLPAGILGLAVLVGGLTACDGDEPPAAAGSTGAPSGAPAASGTAKAEDLELARSEPRQDPVYPSVGNPVVDALHYDLTLDWSGSSGELEGTEELTFRAAQDSENIPLDLSGALKVSEVSLDGEDAGFLQKGADLFVKKPVEADQQYVLTLTYAGTPKPAAAPTTRSDFSLLGWQADTADGTSYTMQEPYGAYTWYAVNDQPSDKAFYDFTITTPQDLTGVANGTMLSDDTDGSKRTTRWHLDSPAASYLVTLATGRFTQQKTESKSGVPLQVWTPSDNEPLSRRLTKQLVRAVNWDEQHLGRLPFSSLGLVVVDSDSGMETQTMMTLGDNDYTLSPEVVAHESIHQWYGDTVTPTDWRGVWMSEGMTMYLQWAFEADHSHGVTTIGSIIEDNTKYIRPLVEQGGPPAEYDPAGFGLSNIYYVPAIMWHRLRLKIGDEEFWKLVKQWPQDHRWSNADYDDITSWWSEQTGLDLQPYFDSWLLEGTPAEVP